MSLWEARASTGVLPVPCHLRGAEEIWRGFGPNPCSVAERPGAVVGHPKPQISLLSSGGNGVPSAGSWCPLCRVLVGHRYDLPIMPTMLGVLRDCKPGEADNSFAFSSFISSFQAIKGAKILFINVTNNL